MMKDSLLLQAATDYNPLKMPTVVLHHQGESNAGGLLLYPRPHVPL